MFRSTLLTAAAVVALMAPAYAEDAAQAPSETQTSFARTIGAIKDWFGPAKPQATPQPAETDTASTDDTIQIPPAPGVQSIEPAAGMDDDLLQVPPQYVGPQSNASSTATPRATAFDNNKAVAAFNDPQTQSASDIAQIAPASGDETPVDMSKVDCKSVLKAAESQEEGADLPDTAIIEACETPQEGNQEGNEAEPVKGTAQPGFEDAPGVAPMPQALPETQPSAGEPPIGGAVMPGEPAAK